MPPGMRTRLRNALLVCLALVLSGNVYATATDLLQRFDPQKLAEAASPDSTLVDGALLTAATADEPAWPEGTSAEAQKAALQAVKDITAEIKDASSLIDGYIGASAAINEDTLRVYAIDIALWRILGGDRDGEVYLSYKNVVDWLTRVSQGGTAHGSTDPDAPGQAAAGVQAQTNTPLFTRAQLDGPGDDRDW